MTQDYGHGKKSTRTCTPPPPTFSLDTRLSRWNCCKRYKKWRMDICFRRPDESHGHQFQDKNFWNSNFCTDTESDETVLKKLRFFVDYQFWLLLPLFSENHDRSLQQFGNSVNNLTNSGCLLKQEYVELKYM